MIKAANIIEYPPTELAFILWQWLQDEPFQFKGRLYISQSIHNHHRIPGQLLPPDDIAHTLIIHWTKKDDPYNSNHIAITCYGTVVHVFDSRGPRVHDSYDRKFDIKDPERFDDLLAYLKWSLPK